MSIETAGSVIVRRPGDGEGTWAMGSLFEHLASSGQTGGAFSVSVVTQPPGVATPLHVHAKEAEAFYILDGSLTYRAGEDIYDLSSGAFIYLPLGVPHAFRITGDRPAQILGIVAPGGLMDLYDEVGIPAAEHRLPGPDGLPMDEEIRRWNEVGPRFGLTVVGPPIPVST